MSGKIHYGNLDYSDGDVVSCVVHGRMHMAYSFAIKSVYRSRCENDCIKVSFSCDISLIQCDIVRLIILHRLDTIVGRVCACMCVCVCVECVAGDGERNRISATSSATSCAM